MGKTAFEIEGLTLHHATDAEALITNEDLPIEEDPDDSREQPNMDPEAGADVADEGSGDETTGDTAAHDTIMRHDMLIQRDDLLKYMQARLFPVQRPLAPGYE